MAAGEEEVADSDEAATAGGTGAAEEAAEEAAAGGEVGFNSEAKLFFAQNLSLFACACCCCGVSCACDCWLGRPWPLAPCRRGESGFCPAAERGPRVSRRLAAPAVAGEASRGDTV